MSTESHQTPQIPDTEDSETSLPELNLDTLPPKLLHACKRAGWDRLMPVQQRAIPHLLAKRDIMVQARTGSGKTGAFVLPMLELLDPELPRCQALVLAPTRELALQVGHEAERLAGEDGIRVAAVYGGVGYKAQREAFEQGAHLVVGTPGRVLDHLLNRAFTLDDLKVLVFDEADRMLSVGFYPDMKELQRYLPRKGFSAYMFSATFPESVLRLANEFLNKPEMLSLSGKQLHVAESLHLYCEVPQMGKERMLIRILEVENPTSAIVFCNTKSDVHYVCEVLKQHGFDAEELSSDLNQSKRERVLGRIRDRQLQFLVATDVAARGIDIPELSHVILYEPPEDPESYIHRAGRTGRAGASGTVVTLVDFVQKNEFKKLMTRFEIPAQEMPQPEEEDVVAAIEQRLTAMLESQHRELSHIQRERVARFLSPAGKLAQDPEAHHLIAMLLDGLYQSVLSKTPEVPDEPTQPRRKTPPKPVRSDDASRGDSDAKTGGSGRQQERPPSEEGQGEPKKRRPRKRRRKKQPGDEGQQES